MDGFIYNSFHHSYRRQLTPCVFLPASGNADGTSVNNRGSNGNYWSSAFNNATNAYNLNFNSGNVNMNNNNRRYGMTVRAVQN